MPALPQFPSSPQQLKHPFLQLLEQPNNLEFMIPILRQERDLYSSAGVDYSTIFQLLPLLINLFQLN